MQSAVTALVLQPADRWQRDCLYPSGECTLSWRKLTFDSLYHSVCCSRRWFQPLTGIRLEKLIATEGRGSKVTLSIPT